MKKTISILALLTLVSFASDAQFWLFPGRNRRASEAAKAVVEATRDSADATSSNTADIAGIESPATIIPERIKISLELPLTNGEQQADDNMFEFYCGALLAAKDLGECGISVDLETVNTRSTSYPRHSRKGVHAVIGPISLPDISRAATLERDSCIYFVSPLDPRVTPLADSLKVVQTPTPASVQAKALADWLESELLPEDKVLVVRQSGEVLDEFSENVLREFAIRGIAYSSFDYNILDALAIPEKYAGTSSENGITRVFAASASEPFLGDVVRNVNLLQYKERKGILYCNSRLRSLPGIEIENLHSAMTRMVATYNVDYRSARTNRFVMEYRALFRCEPGSFSFQGYDVIHYICGAISRLGTSWYEKLPEFSESGLQSDFIFDSSLRSGKVNSGIRKLVYNPDFSISVQ